MFDENFYKYLSSETAFISLFHGLRIPAIPMQISVFQYYSFAAFVLGSIWLITTFYLREHPEFVKKHELFFRDDVGEFTRIKMLLKKRNR